MKPAFPDSGHLPTLSGSRQHRHLRRQVGLTVPLHRLLVEGIVRVDCGLLDDGYFNAVDCLFEILNARPACQLTTRRRFKVDELEIARPIPPVGWRLRQPCEAHGFTEDSRQGWAA